MQKQPAQKSYFFDKGYKDLGNTIKGAWSRNTDSIKKYAGNFGDWYDKPLAVKIFLGIVNILAMIAVIVFGSIITAVITLLVGILVLFLGVSFIKGKNLNLVAGYGSMSETEKAQTDINKIGKLSGKSLIIISVLMFAFTAVSVMFAFQIVSKAIFVFSVVAFIVAVITITIVSVIKGMK